MKVEFSLDGNAVYALQDIIDALMIGRLKQTVDDVKNHKSKHPEDKKYDKEYAKAAMFVIKHFGG